MYSYSSAQGISRLDLRQSPFLAPNGNGRYDHMMDQLRGLKDEAARAMGRGQWAQALQLYAKLADTERQEGTWALRAGDSARRLDEHQNAISWYERAAEAYARRGFVVRAIAVGKMIESLDPGNDRVLRKLDAAQGSSPVARRAPPRPPAPPKAPPKSRPSSMATPPPIPAAAATRPPVPPPVPGPPLHGRLSGPMLNPPSIHEPSMSSVEIVFDDVDDGIPIQDSDILIPEENAEVLREDDSGAVSEIAERLPSFPIFEVLPPGGFLSVVSRMNHRTLDPGEVIVKQGDKGTSLFAIIDGQALVYLEGNRNHPLATLKAGNVFGEMSLVLDQDRAATVEAITEIQLFEMDRELFREVLGEHPQLGDVVSRMIKRRLVENVMSTAPLFKQLDPNTRQELMHKFEVREVPAGTKIVEQDTPCDGLYLIVSGHVYARRSDNGAAGSEPPKIVVVLEPGQTFGASSMFNPKNCSHHSFEAPESTIVLRLPRSAFHEVISFYPPVLEHLSEVADAQECWSSSDPVPVV